MDSLAGQSDAIRVIQGAGHQVFDSKRPLQPRKRKKKKRDFSDRSMRSKPSKRRYSGSRKKKRGKNGSKIPGSLLDTVV